MKQTINNLRIMQNLPLDLKIIKTKMRIKEFYSHYNGNVYVSFSGGKDSTVLKHLVETTPDIYDVPNVFIDTGLEYPEIRKFAISQPNVTVLRPSMRFDEVIKRFGYPVISKAVSHDIKIARNAITSGNYNSPSIKKLEGVFLNNSGGKSCFNYSKYKYLIDADFKISNYCCDVMKKKPLAEYERKTGRKPIIGTLAEESTQRLAKWLSNGCNAFDAKNPHSNPLSFWTDQDILEYIAVNKLPYASIYGDIIKTQEEKYTTTGVKRTGCIFCCFGCHLENYPTRFQRLAETHPKQYDYCIKGGEYVNGLWQPNKEGLGLAHVLDTIGVEYHKEPLLFDL